MVECPECGCEQIETLWVKPEPPKEPYQKWWCVGCGASGIVIRKEESQEE